MLDDYKYTKKDIVIGSFLSITYATILNPLCWVSFIAMIAQSDITWKGIILLIILNFIMLIMMMCAVFGGGRFKRQRYEKNLIIKKGL